MPDPEQNQNQDQDQDQEQTQSQSLKQQQDMATPPQSQPLPLSPCPTPLASSPLMSPKHLQPQQPQQREQREQREQPDDAKQQEQQHQQQQQDLVVETEDIAAADTPSNVIRNTYEVPPTASQEAEQESGNGNAAEPLLGTTTQPLSWRYANANPGASIDALLDVLANKSRSIEMRRLFPEISAYGADFCVASFDCAWAKDILRHGRLYLSLDHLCFYSNILGIIAKVTIPLRSISYIQKRQTAVIIPNAISFTTIDGKSYFFATFNTRDSAYEIIARIWRPLAPLQITSQEQFQQQQQQGTDLAGLSEQVPPLDLDSQDRGDALLNELQDLDRTNQPFPAPSMLSHELRSRRSMIPLSPPQSMQSNQRNGHHSLVYTIFSDPAVVLGFMVFLAIFCTLSMLLTTLTMLIRVQSIANDIDIDIAR